jgi:hypothetical protein
MSTKTTDDGSHTVKVRSLDGTPREVRILKPEATARVSGDAELIGVIETLSNSPKSSE